MDIFCHLYDDSTKHVCKSISWPLQNTQWHYIPSPLLGNGGRIYTGSASQPVRSLHLHLQVREIFLLVYIYSRFSKNQEESCAGFWLLGAKFAKWSVNQLRYWCGKESGFKFIFKRLWPLWCNQFRCHENNKTYQNSIKPLKWTDESNFVLEKLK